MCSSLKILEKLDSNLYRFRELLGIILRVIFSENVNKAYGSTICCFWGDGGGTEYLSTLVSYSEYLSTFCDSYIIVDLEIELAQISEKFKNNPKTTLILGGDFNAGGINCMGPLYCRPWQQNIKRKVTLHFE